MDSDETRYADMARGMLYSKDFVTLYLDRKIYKKYSYNNADRKEQ